MNMQTLTRILTRIFTNFAFIITPCILAACAGTIDPADAYKNETPQQIYQHGVADLKDKSYAEAVKRFEALDVQYPYSPETEKAQFYLIYTYYMKEEYALSVAAADRFIRLHPTYPHIDYAYYMRGIANYYQNLGAIERLFSLNLAKRDTTQVQKSYNDFYLLLTTFPQSEYAASAHQYLVYLRNILANHELDVAQYYYDHAAYVAAANRASFLIAHYSGAPATLQGLRILADSYQHLGLKKQRDDALAILNANNTDTEKN